MAKPIQLPWMNAELAPPKGLEGEVIPLPAHIDREKGITTSVWSLDPQELASVLATQAIALQVTGAHPPVLLTPLTIEQPEELRLEVVTGEENGAVLDRKHVDTAAEALTLVLDALVRGCPTVLVRRL